MRFFISISLALLILPAQALAHGDATENRSSSSAPKVTLLTAEKHYQGDQAEMPYLLTSSLALIVRRNHLRVSMVRTKHGLVAYQTIGDKHYRLPKGSFELATGMLDAWRVKVYRDNKLTAQSSTPWCLDGTAPLRQGRLINDPLPGGCGTSTSMKVTSGIDRQWMANPPEPYQVASNNPPDNPSSNPSVDQSTDQSANLSEQAPIVNSAVYLSDSPLLLKDAGRYRIEMIFDPKRILRLSNDSRRQISFTVDIPEPDKPEAAPMSRRQQMIPDLKALPPTAIDLMPDKDGNNLLAFSSVVWNAGRGPVIVRGRRDTLSGRRMPAYQTLVDEEAHAVATRRIGNLLWDARDGHNHWHYNGLARYSLVDKQGKEVASSGKVGFCFVNTDPINSDYFHPKAYRLRYDQVGNLGCGVRFSLSAYMQLDSGWGDQYGQALPGQAIDVSKLKNGRYRLLVKVNAGHEAKIYESDYGNNSASRSITLSGSGFDREVSVRPWYGESY